MIYLKHRQYIDSNANYYQQRDYWYNILYTFLKPHFSELTHETDSEYFQFGTAFKLRMSSANDGSNFKVYVVFNDETEKDLFGGKYMFQNCWYDFTLLKSDNLTLFSLQRAYSNTVTVLWLKDKDNNLYVGGYYVEDLSQNVNLERATVYKLANTATDSGYTFANPIALSLNPNKICFSNKASLLSGTTYYNDIPDLYSCSKVKNKSTVSLPDGTNYFAVSDNLLVKMTDESEVVS